MSRGAALLLCAAGLAGASAVVLGALGAHLLGPGPDAGPGRLFDTALRYHLVHAVALLGLFGVIVASDAASARWRLRAWLVAAGLCWIAGLLLFSGGLYLRALAGAGSLGPLIPIGGTLYIAGWVLIAGIGVAAMVRRG